MSIAIAELLLGNALPDAPACADAFVAVFQRDPREGYSRGFGQLLSEVGDGADLLRRIHPGSTRNGAAMRSVPPGLIEDRSCAGAPAGLAGQRSMRELLRACVAFGGATDSVAAIALGLTSLSDEFIDDLPAAPRDGVENGPFGRDWLGALDKRLAERFPRRRTRG